MTSDPGSSPHATRKSPVQRLCNRSSESQRGGVEVRPTAPMTSDVCPSRQAAPSGDLRRQPKWRIYEPVSSAHHSHSDKVSRPVHLLSQTGDQFSSSRAYVYHINLRSRVSWQMASYLYSSKQHRSVEQRYYYAALTLKRYTEFQILRYVQAAYA